MEIALYSCENSAVDICSGDKLPDLRCVKNVVLLTEDPGILQVFSDRKSIVSCLGIPFLLSRCSYDLVIQLSSALY